MAKKSIKLIFVSASILATLILLLIVLSFDIGNKVEKIKDIRNKLYLSSEMANNLAALQSDFDKAQPYFAELDNFLPTSDNLINFSSDMTGLAKQSGVSFESQPKLSDLISDNQKNNINSTGMSATIDGGFNNILDFLKMTEKSRYIIKYNFIDIYRLPTSIDYEAKLTGKVFYF